MSGNSISSRVAVHRRYVRSVDVARDVDDPNALDGYVVTPSVRDAAIRIVAGCPANRVNVLIESWVRMGSENLLSECSLLSCFRKVVMGLPCRF